MDNGIITNLLIYIHDYKLTVSINLPFFLTEKEVLLLRHLLSGKSLTEIAHYYNRSLKTISCHKIKLHKKIGVKSDITLWRELYLKKYISVIPEHCSAYNNIE